MIDYSADLYDPVYEVIGVPATLSAGTAGEVTITVIDDTRPKSNIDGTMEVRTIGPGAFARVPELTQKGIVRDDYQGAVLTFNGRSWMVRSHEMRGSPNGEDLGEVRFLLKEKPSGGGGSTAPDWVPADAKIHIDFLGGAPQGRAWVDGTGEVAVDTLLGSDPNSDDAWGVPTEYNSDNLTSDGYRVLAAGGPAGGAAVAFVGVALTKLLTAATVRFVTKQINPGTPTWSVNPLAVVSAGGNEGLEITVTNLGELSMDSFGGAAAAEASGINIAADAMNVIAYTVTIDRLEAAANGDTNLAAAVLDATDRPSEDPMVTALFDYRNNFACVQSITLYDPLPDTTGLSELSAVES